MFQEEIEIKFDVPLEYSESTLIAAIKEIGTNHSWTIGQEKVVRRNFVYYDTPDRRCYKSEETLRRVGGFEPGKDRARFRYDFKIKQREKGLESQYWCNDELAPEQWIAGLALPPGYENILPVAYAKTRHLKLKITKGEDQAVQISLDLFEVQHGPRFQELELELLAGEKGEMVRLAEEIAKSLKLALLQKPKYARVLEGILAQAEWKIGESR